MQLEKIIFKMRIMKEQTILSVCYQWHDCISVPSLGYQPVSCHGVWHVMGGGRGGEKERSGRLSDPNRFGSRRIVGV